MKNKLSAPWAQTPSSNRREPTGTEIATGFPCGPANQPLFNELIYRLSQGEAEIVNTIIAAGMTPSETDLLQLSKAIPLLATGTLINIQAFKTAGTFTYTPTVGTKSVVVEVQAAGGSGGGSDATGANVVILGSGGGSGAYAMSRITTGFAGVTVTVGAKGVPATGAVGVAGGSSSFGALVSAAGGLGGSKAGPIAAPWNSGQAANATPTTGNLINASGSPGGVSVALSAGIGFGASGGPSRFGGGGGPQPAGLDGAPALSPGGGGGGTMNAQNQAVARKGGNGADGIVIVWEYS